SLTRARTSPRMPTTPSPSLVDITAHTSFTDSGGLWRTLLFSSGYGHSCPAHLTNSTGLGAPRGYRITAHERPTQPGHPETIRALPDAKRGWQHALTSRMGCPEARERTSEQEQSGRLGDGINGSQLVGVREIADE